MIKKKVIIKEDASLPKPVRIRLDVTDPAIVKLRAQDSEEPGTRVRVLGRVHRLRSQKDFVFITLSDGYGLLQCILTGDLVKTYDITFKNSGVLFTSQCPVKDQKRIHYLFTS